MKEKTLEEKIKARLSYRLYKEWSGFSSQKNASAAAQSLQWVLDNELDNLHLLVKINELNKEVKGNVR